MVSTSTVIRKYDRDTSVVQFNSTVTKTIPMSAGAFGPVEAGKTEDGSDKPLATSN